MDTMVRDGQLTIERLEGIFHDEHFLVDHLDTDRLEVREHGKPTILQRHAKQRLVVRIREYVRGVV